MAVVQHRKVLIGPCFFGVHNGTRLGVAFHEAPQGRPVRRFHDLGPHLLCAPVLDPHYGRLPCCTTARLFLALGIDHAGTLVTEVGFVHLTYCL